MFRNDLHQLRVFIVFDIMSAFITLRELLCYSTSLAPVAPVWPKSRTRKSFTKPLVSVLFPLKKQGWGLRGLSQPPTLQDSRATHGISMTVMVCCRVTGFSLSAAFPSCPTPFLEGQGVSKSLFVCAGIPVAPGCSGGEQRPRLVRRFRTGRRCHVKKNSWRGVIR